MYIINAHGKNIYFLKSSENQRKPTKISTFNYFIEIYIHTYIHNMSSIIYQCDLYFLNFFYQYCLCMILKLHQNTKDSQCHKHWIHVAKDTFVLVSICSWEEILLVPKPSCLVSLSLVYIAKRYRRRDIRNPCKLPSYPVESTIYNGQHRLVTRRHDKRYTNFWDKLLSHISKKKKGLLCNTKAFFQMPNITGPQQN